jgi:hypothetical protein
LTLKDQITIGCHEINIKINVKISKHPWTHALAFLKRGTKLSFNYFPRNEQATPRKFKNIWSEPLQ